MSKCSVRTSVSVRGVCVIVRSPCYSSYKHGVFILGHEPLSTRFVRSRKNRNTQCSACFGLIARFTVQSFLG
jgi:hypothetical protein